MAVTPRERALSARHRLILDSALEVLGDAGSRALTHRAVDAHAHIPSGSTSYYYSTRSALLLACARRIEEINRTTVDEASDCELEEYVQRCTTMLHRWTTVDRTWNLARLELSLEATRNEEIAQSLARGRDAVRGRIAEMLAAYGSTAPDRDAVWVMAGFTGLFLESLATGRYTLPVGRENVEEAVRAVLSTVLPNAKLAAARSGDTAHAG